MLGGQEMTFKNINNKYFGFYIDIEFWIASYQDQQLTATIQFASDQIISFNDFINDSSAISKQGDYCLSSQTDIYYLVQRKHYYQSQNETLNDIKINVKSGILGIKMLQVYFQKCIEDCIYCDQNKCLQCQSNYAYDEQHNICTYECYRGYYKFTSDKISVCKKCPENCDYCDNKGCQYCSKDYTLSNNKCQKKCDGLLNIFDCLNIITENNEGCDDENCNECKQQEGWRKVKGKNQCERCEKNCLYCDEDKCQQCDYGYTHIGQQCVACGNDCKYCQIASKCRLCEKGFLQEEKCVQQCDSGYFQSDNECLKCQQTNCLDCKDEGIYSCIKCQSGYELKNQICISQNQNAQITCLSSQYYSSSKNSCEYCDQNCKHCLSQHECTQCFTGKPNKIFYGVCDINCPQGFVSSKDSNICQPCFNTKCLDCEDILQNSCKKCSQNYLLQNGICVDTCSEGYVVDTQNQICQKCEVDNCIECDLKERKKCNTCSKDTFFKHTDTQIQCVKSCGIGYFEDTLQKTCKKCGDDCNKCNFNKCTECTIPNVLHYGKCLSKCPSNYYQGTTTRTCFLCPVSKCENCDSENHKCQICQSPLILHQNDCIKECPSPFIYDHEKKICDCEKGYIIDEKNNTCILQCNIQNCQKCNIKGECEACDTDYQQQNGKCSRKCSIEHCADCQQTNTCVQCHKDYYLTDQNSCVASCKDGNIENDIGKTCDQCKINHCSKCNEDINKCTHCMKDYFLQDKNLCVEKCNTGYVETPEQICQKCKVEGCAQCDYSNLNVCINCMNNLFLYQDNQCLTYCPKYYIVQNNSCKQKPPVKFSIAAQSEKYLFQVNLDEVIDEPVINEEQCIQIDIPKLQQGLQITYQVTQQIDKKQYKIQFKVNLVNFIVQTIKVKVSISNKCKPLFDHHEQEVSLDIQPQLTETEKKVSDVIQQTSEISKQIAGNSFFPLAAFGNLRYLASLFDISQLINMMIFVNVEQILLLKSFSNIKNFNITHFIINSIPQNLRTLFDSLEEFQIPFKNIFSFLPNYYEIEYELEGKFEEEGKNGFFLDNAGDSISMVIVLITAKLLLKGLINLGQRNKFIHDKIQRLHDFLFSSSWMYDIIDMSYNQLCFSTFLQMISFTSATYIEEYINYGCLLLAINIILIPILVAFLFKQNKLQSLKDHINKQFDCQGYPFLLFFRKFFFSLSLAFIQKSGLAQLILLVCLHIFTLLFIARYKPMKKSYLNIKEFISSFLFLNATGFMIVLVYGEILEIRFCYNISWIIMVSFGLIIVLDGLLFIYEALAFLIVKVKQLRNYCMKRKEKQSQDKKEKKRHSKRFEISLQRKELSSDIYSNVINQGDLILEKLNQNENENDQKSDFGYSGIQLNAKYSNIQDNISSYNIFLTKKQSSDTVLQSSSLQSMRENNQFLNFDRYSQNPINLKKMSADMISTNNIDIEISDIKSNY